MEFKSYVKKNQNMRDGDVFRLKNNELEMVIYRDGGCENNFFLNCHGLNIIDIPLDTEDFEQAVAKSKNIIEETINHFLSEFAKIKNDDTIQLVR